MYVSRRFFIGKYKRIFKTPREWEEQGITIMSTQTKLKILLVGLIIHTYIYFIKFYNIIYNIWSFFKIYQ